MQTSRKSRFTSYSVDFAPVAAAAQQRCSVRQWKQDNIGVKQPLTKSNGPYLERRHSH